MPESTRSHINQIPDSHHIEPPSVIHLHFIYWKNPPPSSNRFSHESHMNAFDFHLSLLIWNFLCIFFILKWRKKEGKTHEISMHAHMLKCFASFHSVFTYHYFLTMIISSSIEFRFLFLLSFEKCASFFEYLHFINWQMEANACN